MSGSPFIGFSRDHPGVEDISVRCSRMGKEGVSDELGVWSVCLWEVGLLASLLPRVGSRAHLTPLCGPRERPPL